MFWEATQPLAASREAVKLDVQEPAALMMLAAWKQALGIGWTV
jgi:hypothetical protein